VSTVLVTSDRVFFVPKLSDIVETLFKGPTTASGTYQVKRNGILFYDLRNATFRGVARVFLACNKNSDPFFVSCFHYTSKSRRKTLRYMDALCSLDELFLDIRNSSYSEQRHLAVSLWNQVNQLCAVQQ
jgi:hypothetical protein